MDDLDLVVDEVCLNYQTVPEGSFLYYKCSKCDGTDKECKYYHAMDDKV